MPFGGSTTLPLPYQHALRDPSQYSDLCQQHPDPLQRTDMFSWVCLLQQMHEYLRAARQCLRCAASLVFDLWDFVDFLILHDFHKFHAHNHAHNDYYSHLGK
jgi:hypothetical protein